MRYFTIFNKKGFVLYDEGETPSFINNVVQSINTKQLAGSRCIRDDIMEYEIRGSIVYLSISTTKILEARINRFEPIVLGLADNEMITQEMLDASSHAAAQPEEPEKKIKAGKKGDELDFGERSTGISSIVESVKKIDLSRAFRLFSSKIGIDELSQRMDEHLTKKNVDPSFSKIITSDIISGFRDAGKQTVSEAEFKEELSRSLAKTIPAIDHAKLLSQIKGHGGAYTICFVGVNGVGKSTSLAKIACWLIQNGLRVYIAACDTFRAGAIEQLKVHVERFKLSGHEVGFFESGYSKDDASVAKSAIMRAKQEGYDVVLIDTAGRMHNKENLMQSLSKLIRMNNPNHILFVGEALVGGDSLAHIREFNRWIKEGSSGKKIDSILLTKVDTVDDKIGQVLNLAFSASAPVLFLGTGQSNSDLIRMDPAIIAGLLTS